MGVVEVERPAEVVAPQRQKPKPAKVKEPVLAKALRNLRKHGWAHGGWRSNDKRCLVAAINEARGVAYDNDSSVTSAYVQKLGFRNTCEAISWNDEDGRTWEEVEERLERAAYGL